MTEREWLNLWKVSGSIGKVCLDFCNRIGLNACRIRKANANINRKEIQRPVFCGGEGNTTYFTFTTVVQTKLKHKETVKFVYF